MMQGQALRSCPQATQTTPARVPLRLLLLPACLILTFCCAATWPTSPHAGKTQERDDRFLTAPVKHGRLQHVLAEQGLVDAVENIVVTSECEWSRRILRLVPEGEWVEKGEVVVVLDSSELEERLQKREILIINAAAQLANAREALRLQELENESAVAQAELAAMLAELDLEKYHNGEFPKLQNEAEAAVALAEVDLTRARERYEYVIRMARKGFENFREVEKERISLLKYEHELDVARRELDLLVEYTSERQLAELRSLAANAKHELTRARQQADLASGNQQLLVQNRERQYQKHVAYAERLRKSIDACTIRAPKTGEIIYANEGSIRNEIIEGETIRHRQEVVRIPNLNELQVEVRIHESQIDGIAEGLEADVTVDAFPGTVYRGQISSVSRVPTAGSRYTRDLKEYDAAIRIDAKPEKTVQLKPGMTAKADIFVNHRDDCLYVPPQTVVNIVGHPTVFGSTAEGIEHRSVKTGLMTDTGIEVVSGLRGHEQVVLSPRTTCGDQITLLTERFGSETRVENIGG